MHRSFIGNAYLLRRLVPVAALALLVTACSMADFAYDLAPRLAVRFVDDYLQLDNRQAEQALVLFRERHALHARDELPRYYRFLVETETATRDGIDAGEVDAVFDQVREFFRLGIERTIPAAAEILAGLNVDQLDALQERLQEDVAEDRKRLAEDHAARRRKETLEDFEEWVGDLAEPQQQMIMRELKAMEETRPLWLNWQITRNEQLIELLRSRPQRDAIEAFLADYWIHQSSAPEELVQGMTANRQRYRAMIVALDGSMSERQRRSVREKLEEYREMVLDMMPEEIRVVILEELPGNPAQRIHQ